MPAFHLAVDLLAYTVIRLMVHGLMALMLLSPVAGNNDGRGESPRNLSILSYPIKSVATVSFFSRIYLSR